ncbi:MAG TPA: hypothetical protein PKA98_11480, partial [Acidimicrobiales bacterium]|nr:hypothetical protein [Acidimicrobiales bacterium]
MKANDLPVGAATSIGSLPHEAADAAVALVLEEHGWLPAAPSLPGRSPLEGMVAQAAWGMPGVTVLGDGSLDLVLDDIDPEAPPADADLAGEPFLGLRVFFDAVAGRRGWVKLQLTGPVTLGLALHAAGLDPGRAFPAAGTAVPRHAVIAFDGTPASGRLVDWLATVGLVHGAEVTLVGLPDLPAGTAESLADTTPLL